MRENATMAKSPTTKQINLAKHRDLYVCTDTVGLLLTVALEYKVFAKISSPTSEKVHTIEL